MQDMHAMRDESTQPDVSSSQNGCAVSTSLTPQEREKLILDKMDMARRAAVNFHRDHCHGIEREELENEAYLALTEAARCYDPHTTCLPFGPYAAQRIAWRLNDFVRTWNRLSRVDYLNGRKPRRVFSFVAQDEPGDDPEVTNCADPVSQCEAREILRLSQKILTPREQDLIDLRYLHGKNLLEISKLIGVTHLRARQIHSEVMKLLRGVLSGKTRVRNILHRSRVTQTA